MDFMYSLDEVRAVDAEVAQAIVDEQERQNSHGCDVSHGNVPGDDLADEQEGKADKESVTVEAFHLILDGQHRKQRQRTHDDQQDHAAEPQLLQREFIPGKAVPSAKRRKYVKRYVPRTKAT